VDALENGRAADLFVPVSGSNLRGGVAQSSVPDRFRRGRADESDKLMPASECLVEAL
jgi:hypothetical protein